MSYIEIGKIVGIFLVLTFTIRGIIIGYIGEVTDYNKIYANKINRTLRMFHEMFYFSFGVLAYFIFLLCVEKSIDSFFIFLIFIAYTYGLSLTEFYVGIVTKYFELYQKKVSVLKSLSHELSIWVWGVVSACFVLNIEAILGL